MKKFEKLPKEELMKMSNIELREHIKWCEDVNYIDFVLGIILTKTT